MAGEAALARACRLSHGRGPAHGEEDGHGIHLTAAPEAPIRGVRTLRVHQAASGRVFRVEEEHVCRFGAGDPEHVVGLPEDDEGLVEKRRRLVRRHSSAREEREDQFDARAELDRSVPRIPGAYGCGFEEIDRAHLAGRLP